MTTSDDTVLMAIVELGKQTALMHSALAEARTDALELAVGDFQGREMVLDQFPVPGAKRVIVGRTGNGFDSLAVPTTGVLALPPNEGRLGMRLVNSGATNAIILYLADQKRAGIPAVWLAPAGGAWDGRLGNVLWAGNVFAVAQLGASALTGGEV